MNRLLLACLMLVGACSSRHSDSPALSAASAPLIDPSHQTRKWPKERGIIDSHVHISPTQTGLGLALEVFERAGIDRFVVKSAGVVGSRKYQAHLAMQEMMGERMRLFVNLDWTGIDDPGFADREVARLRQAAKDGAIGVKVFKALGLAVRTADGKLLPADDPRLIPIFEACAELGLIFAWHIADPVAFFEPVTPANERYAELSIAESWSFFGKDYPSFQSLMEAQERVIARHPKTVFLLIHFGNNAEDLDYVDRLLDRYPNVYVDTSARVPELGRHNAEKLRALFIKQQDRILFGSDIIFGSRGQMQLGSVSPNPPTPDDAEEFYARHWRFFETGLRQIEHPTPIQGDWKIDAIDLPMDVLEKIYVKNAEKLLFSKPFRSQ